MQQSTEQKPRTLIFIVAYRAEPFIGGLLERIFKTLPALTHTDISILVIDDSSPDDTSGQARKVLQSSPVAWEVLRTPSNRGYGGNQKLGYTYALTQGFDYVALLHGDGQYAPEYLPALLEPLIAGQADGVLGSRMIRREDARKGGMPFHKICGNTALTWIQNRLLNIRLAEFHTGMRAWRVASLAKLPFTENDNGFCFDTEILIQMVDQKQRLAEIPIPTYYGDEPCHVNSVRYSKEVVTATVLSRLQSYAWAKRARYRYHPAPVHPDPVQSSMLAQMRGTARTQVAV